MPRDPAFSARTLRPATPRRRTGRASLPPSLPSLVCLLALGAQPVALALLAPEASHALGAPEALRRVSVRNVTAGHGAPPARDPSSTRACSPRGGTRRASSRDDPLSAATSSPSRAARSRSARRTRAGVRLDRYPYPRSSALLSTHFPRSSAETPNSAATATRSAPLLTSLTACSLRARCSSDSHDLRFFGLAMVHHHSGKSSYGSQSSQSGCSSGSNHPSS